jgi:hypothetical protein
VSIAQARSSLAMVRTSADMTLNGEWRATTSGPGSDTAAVRPSSRMNVETFANTLPQVVSPLTMADGVGW